jgi:hypothetical protein
MSEFWSSNSQNDGNHLCRCNTHYETKTRIKNMSISMSNYVYIPKATVYVIVLFLTLSTHRHLKDWRFCTDFSGRSTVGKYSRNAGSSSSQTLGNSPSGDRLLHTADAALLVYARCLATCRAAAVTRRRWRFGFNKRIWIFTRSVSGWLRKDLLLHSVPFRLKPN